MAPLYIHGLGWEPQDMTCSQYVDVQGAKNRAGYEAFMKETKHQVYITQNIYV